MRLRLIRVVMLCVLVRGLRRIGVLLMADKRIMLRLRGVGIMRLLRVVRIALLWRRRRVIRVVPRGRLAVRLRLLRLAVTRLPVALLLRIAVRVLRIVPLRRRLRHVGRRMRMLCMGLRVLRPARIDRATVSVGLGPLLARTACLCRPVGP